MVYSLFTFKKVVCVVIVGCKQHRLCVGRDTVQCV